ncbi:hypothetical protein ABZP36_006157 [Zizania latifolia]
MPDSRFSLSPELHTGLLPAFLLRCRLAAGRVNGGPTTARLSPELYNGLLSCISSPPWLAVYRPLASYIEYCGSLLSPGHRHTVNGGLAANFGRLTKEQLSRVKEIGLECLLSIPAMPIQRIIVEDLAEKYNEVADDCFDYGLHKHPLIANWGGNKVAKHAQLEGVKKSGCAKVVIHLQGDDGKAVTLSDNWEGVSDDDHNFEGSRIADDTLQWIKDKLLEFENDTDFKFVTLLQRIEWLEDRSTCFPRLHSTLQGAENTKGSCRTDDEAISSIKVRLSALEKDTNDKYASILRRIDLMEDRNKCLMQVNEVLEELDLTSYEKAAFAYVQNEIDLGVDKDLVLNAYASIFNSSWEKDTKQVKHVVSAYHSDWLRMIGKDWMKSSAFCARVLIPINTTNSHWWLCVLCPAKKELQILDPLKRRINYEEESKDLRYGIHSVLEAVHKCPPKLEYRWDYSHILQWDVVVVQNIARQQDGKKMPAELILSPLNEYDFVKDDVIAMGDRAVANQRGYVLFMYMSGMFSYLCLFNLWDKSTAFGVDELAVLRDCRGDALPAAG